MSAPYNAVADSLGQTRASGEKHGFDHMEKAEGGTLRNDPDEGMDPVEIKRIIRKIDFRLIPLLITLYTLTFLDRVNIGSAKLWGLQKDLHMKGYDYNIVVLVFYIPYILLEIPSNMIITRVQPRYWISFLCFGWGITVCLAGFCKSYGGFLTARIFIGVFEAGMFPGCLFLIGSWYTRHDLLTRMAFFMVSNDIAGCISGLLGAGLGSLDGTAGYGGWSWIFFIEGGVTVVFGAIAFFAIPPFPHQSKFLAPEEKAYILRRLDHDAQRNNTTHEKMTARGALRSLRDWKILSGGMLYLAVCVTAYSISVFTPSILRTFGWSSIKSNLLTAPTRIASGICSVAVGFLSDKMKRRGIFCLGGYLLSIAGLLMVMLIHNGNIRYVGLYFAAIGIYICQPMVIAWPCNQVVGNVKRGAATAFAVSCGQLGGIISALVFPDSDKPYYVNGISTCIAFQVAGILTVINMWYCCRWENKQRDLGKRDHLRDLPEEDLNKLGEKHPDFRYTL